MCFVHGLLGVMDRVGVWVWGCGEEVCVCEGSGVCVCEGGGVGPPPSFLGGQLSPV